MEYESRLRTVYYLVRRQLSMFLTLGALHFALCETTEL
jgi:hypothetical protein